LVLKMAKDLKAQDKIPCSAQWNDDLNYFDVCSNVKLDDDFSYLLGFFIADGHFPRCSYNGKYYGAVIDQSVDHNSHKIKRIKEILDRLGTNYTYRERNKNYEHKGKKSIKRQACFYITGKTRDQIMSIVGSHKSIPDNILQWKKTLLTSFLDGFVDGDGYHRKFYNTFGVVQKDIKWLDVLHAIGVRLGYDSFVRHRQSNSMRNTGYVEFNERKYKVLRNRESKSLIQEKNYEGIMWCPFIKNNHFFVARRNGRVFITGNCFPLELPKRLLQQLTYADDIVLDPFSGSGTTCVIAKTLRRNFIGIEMSKKYYEASLKRLGETPDMISIKTENGESNIADWMVN